MTTNKAARRCGNNERAYGSSPNQQVIIPDWAALVIGIGLGWPLIAWAVMSVLDTINIASTIDDNGKLYVATNNSGKPVAVCFTFDDAHNLIYDQLCGEQQLKSHVFCVPLFFTPKTIKEYQEAAEEEERQAFAEMLQAFAEDDDDEYSE